jgi:hypothetical protein
VAEGEAFVGGAALEITAHPYARGGARAVQGVDAPVHPDGARPRGQSDFAAALPDSVHFAHDHRLVVATLVEVGATGPALGQLRATTPPFCPPELPFAGSAN